MREGTRVTAVVPAYNEAERVAGTVRALLRLPEVEEVLVVDDGSTDATARLAGEAGARVLRLPCRRGKGTALEAGIRSAAGDVLLLVDADLGDEAAKTACLLPAVLSGEADLAVACLPSPRGAGGFGLVKAAARYGIRLLGGVLLRAPLSGQRAAPRPVLEALLPLAGGYGAEVGMSLEAARRKLVVREVAVDLHHQPTGNDLAGLVHRARQLRDVLATLARRWRRR